MGLGSQFIKSIITSGSGNALLDMNESFFTEDEGELPLYAYVRDHLNRYGTLPSTEAVAQAGHTLPFRAGDNVQYYIDQLRVRKQFNGVNSLNMEFIEKMKERKMLDVRNVVQRMMEVIDEGGSPNAYSNMVTEVGGVYEDYMAYRWSGNTLRGITTGWETCDQETLGFQPGDLAVIVGRPGMGKSYKLIESAYQANSTGRSAMIMSMEMTVKQIGMRWLARKSGVNPLAIRKGQVSTWGEGRMREAVQEIQRGQAPIYLEAGDMEKSIDAVEAMFLKHMPDIIYLDSAYLFSPAARHKGFISRWETITSVINDLKKMALRLNRAIVITVQFNRNVKTNGFKELDMGDIGDSDAIPRNASIILGMRKHKPPFQTTRRHIQMMKNRDGGTVDYGMLFEFSPVCFEECELPHEDEEEEENPDEPRSTRRGRLDLSYMR